MTSPPSGRYRVTLTTADADVAHGWWDSKATACQKMTIWIDEWGRPGTRITLVDEESGDVLERWPDGT